MGQHLQPILLHYALQIHLSMQQCDLTRLYKQVYNRQDVRIIPPSYRRDTRRNLYYRWTFVPESLGAMSPKT